MRVARVVVVVAMLASIAQDGGWASSAVTWTPIGPSPIQCPVSACFFPGPFSGRVTSVAPDPSSPAIVYAGTAGGGVWKTTDDGSSWTPLFDQEPSLSIGAVAVDPVTPSTVYVGTGEGVHNGYYGLGIFKSADGGTTWSKLGGTAFDNCHVTDLLVDPADHAVVVASLDAYMGVHDGASPRCVGGIYRSPDGGATWTRVYSSTETGDFFDEYDYGVSDLAVDPLTPSRWFAAVSGDAVYRSTDTGQTWARMSSGFPTTDVGRIEIALAPSAPSTIYAAVVNSAHDQTSPGRSGELLGIWKTTDGAASWSPISFPSDVCGVGSIQCDYDLTLAVDPSNPSVMFIAGVLLYRTGDGGGSYQLLNPNTKPRGTILPHVDFHALDFDASGRLWIGNDGGVYRTADQGDTFSNLNSNLATILVNTGISGTVSGPLWAGVQDNGTLKDPGSHTWTEVLGGDGGVTAVDPTDPNVVYVEINGKVYRTTNGGSSFSFVGADIPDSDPSLGVGGTPLEMDPSNPQTLYFGTNRVWRTTNGGGSWSPVSPALGSPGIPQCCISAIAIAPSDPSTLYVGTGGGRLQMTTNGGATWTDTGGPLPDRFVSAIAVSPTDAAGAYVTLRGFGAPHVFHTTDAGGSWTDISAELPDVPMDSVTLDGRVTPPRVFVGGDRGVYVTDHQGAWWGQLTGIPNAVVNDLLFEPATGNLVAATYGRGLFAATIPADFVVPPPPPPPNHARTLSLTLSGHLRARGTLRTADNFVPCQANQEVLVERKTKTGWVVLRRPITNADGGYTARVPEKTGGYRAQVLQSSASGETCASAISPVRRYVP